MLTALIIIIAFILMIILLILFLPVMIEGRTENRTFRGSFQWGPFRIQREDSCACLYLWKWIIIRSDKKEDVENLEKKAEEKILKKIQSSSKKEKRGRDSGRVKKIISQRKTASMLFSKSTELFKRIIKGMRIDRLRVELRDFPSEPHLAGMWYGYYYAAVYPYLPSNTTVIYEPFEKSEIKAKTEIELKIYLYRVVISILWFLITTPKMETIRFIRSLKN